jgi:dCTP diphosphatase
LIAARGSRKIDRRTGRRIRAMTEIVELQQRLRAFAAARDWDQFHSPKNLSMALIAEAAELVEHFQWLGERESAALDAATLAKVRLEAADVFIYLVRLADKLGIDLVAAARDKIALNEQKYPADRVRGQARKPTDL